MIEQAKFTYSQLSKAFEKQIKTIEEQGKKTRGSFRSFTIFYPKINNQRCDSRKYIK